MVVRKEHFNERDSLVGRHAVSCHERGSYFAGEGWMMQVPTFSPGITLRALTGLLVLIGISIMGGRVQAQTVPGNDLFRRPELISGLSGQLTGSNSNATAQAGEPNHAGVTGGKSVWYRWQAPSTAQATFSTVGSSFDTLLAVYTGNSLSDLKEVKSNNDLPGGTSTNSLVTFPVIEGAEYRIVIDGNGGVEGEIKLQWTTEPLNDLFVNAQLLTGFAGTVRNDNFGAQTEMGETGHAGPDANHTVWFAWPSIENSSVTFTTEGSAFDTVLAVYTGEALDDLSLVAESDDFGGGSTSSVSWLAEAGVRYRIVVGSKDATGRYVLHWRQEIPPPSNDNLSQAIQLGGYAGQRVGNSAGATLEPGEPTPQVLPGGSSVWFTWNAPRNGEIIFETPDSAFDTQLAAFNGESLETLKLITANDDTEDGLSARIQFTATEGSTYYLCLDGKGGSGDFYLLKWIYSDLTSTNNAFTNATVIRSVIGKITGENYSATTEAGEPQHADDPGGRSIWYRWTAPVSFRVIFDTLDSSFDTLLAAYTGISPVLGLTEIDSNDDVDQGNLRSQIDFDAVAGTTYMIAVDGSSENGSKPAGLGEVHLQWQPSSTTTVYPSPAKGSVGEVITLYGRGLTAVSTVQFGTVSATFSETELGLQAVVPENALTGPITVVNQNGDILTSLEDFVVVPSSSPQLNIRAKDETTVRIAWPSLFPGFKAQQAANLFPEPIWSDLPDPVQVGGEFVVEDPMTESQRFYRLIRP